jgi:hypothetical protein
VQHTEDFQEMMQNEIGLLPQALRQSAIVDVISFLRHLRQEQEHLRAHRSMSETTVGVPDIPFLVGLQRRFPQDTWYLDKTTFPE